MAYCWEFGGVTPTGKKCFRRMTHSRCPDHTVEKVSQIERQKEELLSLLDGTVTLPEACEQHGEFGPTTVRGWMQTDEVFKRKVQEATAHFHAHIGDLAKAQLRDRITEGTATPTELIHALKSHPTEPLAPSEVLSLEDPQEKDDRVAMLARPEIRAKIRELQALMANPVDVLQEEDGKVIDGK